MPRHEGSPLTDIARNVLGLPALDEVETEQLGVHRRRIISHYMQHGGASPSSIEFGMGVTDAIPRHDRAILGLPSEPHTPLTDAFTAPQPVESER